MRAFYVRAHCWRLLRDCAALQFIVAVLFAYFIDATLHRLQLFIFAVDVLCGENGAAK